MCTHSVPAGQGNIIATALIALSLLSWQVARLGAPSVGLILRSGLFAPLTADVARLVGSPLEPEFTPGSAIRLWQQIIVSLWWLLAARLAIKFARRFLLHRSFSREGRLFSDSAGLLYLAVPQQASGLRALVRGHAASMGQRGLRARWDRPNHLREWRRSPWRSSPKRRSG